MTELHIKVHQIHKAKSGEILVGIVIGVSHTVGIGFVIHIFCQADTGKNIVNLTHANGSKTCIFHSLRQGDRRRLQRKVMAVGGALEAARLTDKGTGNDPAYAVLALKNFPGNPAVFV